MQPQTHRKVGRWTLLLAAAVMFATALPATAQVNNYNNGSNNNNNGGYRQAPPDPKQIASLIADINRLQTESARYSVSQLDLPKPPTGVSLTNSTAYAETQRTLGYLRMKLVAAAYDTPAYQQAVAQRNVTEEKLKQAKAKNPVQPAEVAALATELLAAENAVTRIEDSTVENSPEWKHANAGVNNVGITPLEAQQQRVAEARQARDDAWGRAMSGVKGVAEYKQAVAQQDAAQAKLDQAKAQVPKQPEKVAAAATELLAAENAVTRLEQAVRDSIAASQPPAAPTARTARTKTPPQPLVPSDRILQSPPTITAAELKDADERYKEAVAELAALNSKLGELSRKTGEVAQQKQQLVMYRGSTEAQINNLMAQLRALSPADAIIAQQYGKAVLQELTQLHDQSWSYRTSAGAPAINFSSDISGAVQSRLQGELDEAERMKDPVYAAKKAEEARAEAERVRIAQEKEAAEEAQRAQARALLAAENAAWQAQQDAYKAQQDAAYAQQQADYLQRQLNEAESRRRR